MEPITTPCAICGLPVGSPSMSGPGICPTCDMGKYRDGSPMDTTCGLDLIKERAKKAANRAERERNLRRALADLVAAAERAQNKFDDVWSEPDELGYIVYPKPDIDESFKELWPAVERARKVMKEE